MRKMRKKLMALTMAGVMMCAPMTVFAETGTTESTTDGANGTTSGTGTVEGYVDPDVFRVVLPTDDSNDPTFNFTLDPSKLLHATDGEHYTDEDATVWFNTKTGTSNALGVVNKGNVKVKVAVTAEVSNLNPVTLTSDNTFAGDTTTSLYLGLKVGDNAAVAVDPTTSKAEASDIIDGVAEENFEIAKIDTDSDSTPDTYVKQLKSSVDTSTLPTTSFSLTGACNGNADWSSATTAAPSVAVTWTLTKVTETTVPESDTTTPITITFTGDAPAAGSIEFTKPDGTVWTPPASAYTSNIIIDADAKTITFTTTWLALAKSNFGAGTYSPSINGTSYPFIIK